MLHVATLVHRLQGEQQSRLLEKPTTIGPTEHNVIIKAGFSSKCHG